LRYYCVYYYCLMVFNILLILSKWKEILINDLIFNNNKKKIKKKKKKKIRKSKNGLKFRVSKKFAITRRNKVFKWW
jgi:hypothetical protein